MHIINSVGYGGNVMFCGFCGNKIEDDAMFCPFCGGQTDNQQVNDQQMNSQPNRTKVTFPVYENATMPTSDNGTRVYAPQQLTGDKNKKNIKVKASKSPSKKRFRKRIIAIVAVMIILVGSIGAYFIWRSSDTKDEAYFKPFSYEDIVFPESGDAYIKNELILTGSKDSSFKKIKKLVEKVSGEVVGYVSMSNDYQIEFKKEKSKEELDDIIGDWSKNDLVASVGYHYVYETDGSIFDYTNDEWWNYKDGDKPDDFEENWDIYAPYGNNWGVESVWMPKVWESDTEFKPVKVGIIDTMFDKTHPDLDGRFKKAENNPDSIEYTVQTGSDSDATASAGDAAMANDTYLYHGTHVAGIIGAVIDNGVGIAGVAQNAELYGFSMAAPDGTLYTSIMEWKAAIGMQLLDGVKAINISMDVTLNDPAEMDQLNSEMERFLRACLNKEYYFLIFKAADSADNPTPGFLSGIQNGNVRSHIIVVGGAEYVYDENGTLQGYKAIDDQTPADIYAPGKAVDSDVPGGLTENHDGTSVAAPFVTGEAALIWGVNKNLTCKEVRDIILNNYVYEVEAAGTVKPYANVYLAVEAAIKTVDKNHESEDLSTKTDAAIDVEDEHKSDYDYDEQLYAPVLSELKETVNRITNWDRTGGSISFEATDFELEEDGRIVDSIIVAATGTTELRGEYYWFDDIDGDGTDEMFFSEEPQEIEENGKKRICYHAEMFVAKTDTGYKIVNLDTYIRESFEYLGNGVFYHVDTSGADGKQNHILYSYNGNSMRLERFAYKSSSLSSSESTLYEGDLTAIKESDWNVTNKLEGDAAEKRWTELIDEYTVDPHPWANIERRNIKDYNSGETGSESGDDPYKEILTRAKKQATMSDEEYYQIDEPGRMFGDYRNVEITASLEYNKELLGYLLMDLNNDGVDELILAYDEYITRLYTIKNSQLVVLLAGGGFDAYTGVQQTYLGNGQIYSNYCSLTGTYTSRQEQKVYKMNDSGDALEVVNGILTESDASSGESKTYIIAGTDKEFNIPGYQNGQTTDVEYNGTKFDNLNNMKQHLEYIPILEYSENQSTGIERPKELDGIWETGVGMHEEDGVTQCDKIMRFNKDNTAEYLVLQKDGSYRTRSTESVVYDYDENGDLRITRENGVYYIYNNNGELDYYSPEGEYYQTSGLHKVK